MGLIWRVLATIAGTNLIVMFVFVSLATLQFEAVLSGLVKERLEVLATRARDPFVAVVDLGLPVSTVRNGRAALEAIRQNDPAIQDILVFSPDGLILHTTSQTAQETVPWDWIHAPREGGAGDVFYLSGLPQFIVGADIRSGEETVAGIAIVYSKAQSRDQVRAMAAKLAFVAGVIMVATILFSILAIRFSLSEHLKVFSGILRTYDLFARSFWRGRELQIEKPETVTGLGVSTDQFWELLQDTEQTYVSEREALSRDGKDIVE